MSLIGGYVLIVVTLFIVLFLFTWYRFRKTIYVHTSENSELLKKFPLRHSEVTLTTNDSVYLSAWYIPVVNPKAVIILIPGFTDLNGGKALMLPHAAYLSESGYSTLLLDLRSTGNSEGNKSYLGTKEWQDVQAAYDYLKIQPENRNVKIGLFGVSMGASTAIITTGKTGKGDFIIASVPYASFERQFTFQLEKEHLPVWMFLPLLKLSAIIEFGASYGSYDPSRLIKNVHVPILIFAAKMDGDVGNDQGAILYELAHKPKYFWSLDTHHDIHKEKPVQFQERILTFLTTIT